MSQQGASARLGFPGPELQEGGAERRPGELYWGSLGHTPRLAPPQAQPGQGPNSAVAVSEGRCCPHPRRPEASGAMGPGALSSLLVLLLLVASGDADMKGHFDPAKCRYALGMQDRTIPDSDISVSSSWSDSTAARHSRLESSDGDGAWCPAGPVFPKEEEYLQVDLRRLHLVALVGTQGRHAGGLGKEFSRSYRLRYSRDGHRWMDWKDRWGQEIISGNEDPEGVVLKDLGPPMVARLVRFYPRADRVMSVCLRVELYGCLWRDGLLSYTAPVGQTMYLSEAVHLNDSTYDGYTVSGLQYGGLGQLADGVVGLDDFRQSQELRVWPGYDYVGWSNQSFPGGYVEMEFEFDRLRAFQAMQVHCNNMHTLGARLPGGVECRFRRGPAVAWEGEPVRHALGGSLGDPRARAVSVPLGGRVGRFLQCRFLFGGPWLLFSEISFISDVVNDSSQALGGTFPPAPWWPPGPPPTNFSSLELEPRGQQPVAKAEGSPTAILIGCLVAIILLLLLIIALMLWRLHWRRLLGKAERRVLEEELTVHLSVPGDTILINNRPGPREPPPYQEPRPRGNPPHSAPCVPNGSACTGHYMEPEKPGAPLLPPPPQNSVPHYAEADIVTLQGVTGGNTYAVPALPPGAAADGPPRVDFPRSRLRFKEKLGEGQFGEGRLCPPPLSHVRPSSQQLPLPLQGSSPLCGPGKDCVCAAGAGPAPRPPEPRHGAAHLQVPPHPEENGAASEWQWEGSASPGGRHRAWGGGGSRPSASPFQPVRGRGGIPAQEPVVCPLPGDGRPSCQGEAACRRAPGNWSGEAGEAEGSCGGGDRLPRPPHSSPDSSQEAWESLSESYGRLRGRPSQRRRVGGCGKGSLAEGPLPAGRGVRGPGALACLPPEELAALVCPHRVRVEGAAMEMGWWWRNPWSCRGVTAVLPAGTGVSPGSCGGAIRFQPTRSWRSTPGSVGGSWREGWWLGSAGGPPPFPFGAALGALLCNLGDCGAEPEGLQLTNPTQGLPC
uniref:Discoidin domain receptor tyrosine kinase 1 n=1 Tax=Oryctolagus cuniculus TaxID=9986 RepID=A0A5F9CXK4_RABIT